MAARLRRWRLFRAGCGCTNTFPPTTASLPTAHLTPPPPINNSMPCLSALCKPPPLRGHIPARSEVQLGNLEQTTVTFLCQPLGFFLTQTLAERRLCAGRRGDGTPPGLAAPRVRSGVRNLGGQREGRVWTRTQPGAEPWPASLAGAPDVYLLPRISTLHGKSGRCYCQPARGSREMLQGHVYSWKDLWRLRSMPAEQPGSKHVLGEEGVMTRTPRVPGGDPRGLGQTAQKSPRVLRSALCQLSCRSPVGAGEKVPGAGQV